MFSLDDPETFQSLENKINSYCNFYPGEGHQFLIVYQYCKRNPKHKAQNRGDRGVPSPPKQKFVFDNTCDIGDFRAHILETFSTRFFKENRKPQTAECLVTTALQSCLQFAVHIWTAGEASSGKWFTARFFFSLWLGSPGFISLLVSSGLPCQLTIPICILVLYYILAK